MTVSSNQNELPSQEIWAHLVIAFKYVRGALHIISLKEPVEVVWTFKQMKDRLVIFLANQSS